MHNSDILLSPTEFDPKKRWKGSADEKLYFSSLPGNFSKMGAKIDTPRIFGPTIYIGVAVIERDFYIINYRRNA